MPLLHKKTFMRRKPPQDLQPDEEVFHCKVTNEVFRDYNEFFERTILCNSLVWSCGVTGKPGLTYQEAVESERKAQQNLQNFPEPLIVPVLYLTTLTYSSRFHEICDDIFAYVKDRFFVGETVEALSSYGTRLQCKVLEAIAPPQHNGMANGHAGTKLDGDIIVISDSDDEEPSGNVSVAERKMRPVIAASQFKYKVKPTKEGLEPIVVQACQLSRRKDLFSRDKLKLLLKQHCESKNGVIVVKASSLTKYRLSELQFSYIFSDEPPTFTSSPVVRGNGRPPFSHPPVEIVHNTTNERITDIMNMAAREMENLKRHREEMRAMALERAKLKQRADFIEAKKREKEDKEKKREVIRKMLEDEKLKRKEERERLRLEKEKEKEKLREEKRRYAEYLKLWSKPREDMECDDHKELPPPTPVKTRLPPENFGDALMVLEFLHAFGDLFDLQDEFPDGVTLALLEEALVGSDPEGPLCELLFFFLTAIFQAMAEEEEEVAKDQLTDADRKDLTEALDEDADTTKSALNAVASLAAAWPQLHQGCSLKDLDLDSCTLTEIIRLHILAAGSDVNLANAKYRYQKQGGFDASDDACLELRLSNPCLLKKLSTVSVYDLLPGEKLKILHAFCGKLLTLVPTRDFIEDNNDILKQAKQEFRELKAEQNRKEKEEAAARIRKKREERLKEQELRMKERIDKLREDEQKTYTDLVMSNCEDKDELDTSTESGSALPREQTLDTTIEDEEDSSPIPKTKKGKKELNQLNQNGKRTLSCERNERLIAQQEEALKHEQQQQEKELMETIQSATACTNIVPLGRDRVYRRYWIFSSLPGLFVEEDYTGITEDMLLPQTADLSKDDRLSQEFSKNGDFSELVDCSISTSDHLQVFEPEITEKLCKPVHKPNQWYYYSSIEELDQLIEALNTRGCRENALKETLLQEKERINEKLTKFPEENFNIPDKPQTQNRPTSGRGRSSQNLQDLSPLSAEKQLEIRLRDLLLDIEDRIYQGTLGTLKVLERMSWRIALENGNYELLYEDAKENGTLKTEADFENEMEIDDVGIKFGTKERLCELKNESQSCASTSTSTPQPTNSCVRYLATALLQIEQGIERRFLKAPLGDAEDSRKDQKGDKRKKEDKKKKEEDQNSEKDGKYSDFIFCVYFTTELGWF
ncbi:bromodomain adjacent to zinc finger domain protein 1A isoform X2 [Protopterus annectens]|uniref:bromodomain adjacent to zinc finger domain protein 1A isoform X2 n=1 Tax=Protopterus annectens TaxID=7888 RepID=UPI001CFB1B73|nr:bromodomain adjacent to zinc finger domain protein 1A isoform X2 [Protopterus annectens]